MKPNITKFLLAIGDRIGLASPTPPRPLGSSLLKDSLGSGDALFWQGNTPPIQLPHPAAGWPPGFPDFNRPGVSAQSIFLARLQNARVFGPSVAVCSSRNLLIKEVSVEWRPRSVPWPMRRFRFPPAKKLSGRSILLASTGGETFYHFLLEVLPRLDLIRRAGIRLSPQDRLIINDLRPAFVRELLAKTGVSFDRCVETHRYRHLYCEELLVPSLPGQIGSPHQGIGDFYESLFPADSGSGTGQGPGLFLKRAGVAQRKLRQAAAVSQILASHGIEEVDMGRMPVALQAEKIRRASFVIAPHGAALSNLVFCQPPTAVLELFAPGYINQCYRMLAAMRKLPYAYLVGRTDGSRSGPNRPGDASGDLFFDMETFRKAVTTIQGISRSPASV